MAIRITCVSLSSVDDGRTIELDLRVWRAFGRSRSYPVRTPLRVERALCLVTAHHRRARAWRLGAMADDLIAGGTAAFEQVRP